MLSKTNREECDTYLTEMRRWRRVGEVSPQREGLFGEGRGGI